MPGKPYIPLGFRRLTTQQSRAATWTMSILSFDSVSGSRGRSAGTSARNRMYRLMLVGASTAANPPRRSSVAISAALLTITTGSAPNTAFSRRRARATIVSARPGAASNSTLPLAMNVRTWPPPARAKASLSASFRTSPRPPTFTARRSAT
jgi:hypothetical protein